MHNTLNWQKSSYCGTNACIEVAFYGDGVAIRDGKDHNSPTLEFDMDEWEAFVKGIRAGEFDPASLTE